MGLCCWERVKWDDRGSKRASFRGRKIKEFLLVLTVKLMHFIVKIKERAHVVTNHAMMYDPILCAIADFRGVFVGCVTVEIISMQCV